MEDMFMLPVIYNGEEKEFEVKLIPYTYTYRFEVTINGVEVQFEPDEEQNYRALLTHEQLQMQNNRLDINLLEVVAGHLKELHG